MLPRPHIGTAGSPGALTAREPGRACRNSQKGWGVETVTKPKDLELRTIELADPVEPIAPTEGEIDAAESRWDPWLLALAKMAALAKTRPN